MFERIAQTKEEKDAEAAEGRSPGQIAGLRLAAVLLVVDAVAALAVATIIHAPDTPILHALFALGLGFYLFKLRPRAEALAMGLTIIAAVLQPIVLLLQVPLLAALIAAIPVWGISGAVLLLMTGDPSRVRRIAAVLIFCVCTLGFHAAVVLFARTTAAG